MAAHRPEGPKVSLLRPSAIASMLDPRVLISLAILVVNDHYLKAAHRSWLTGKLSDVAGMVIFPVVLLVTSTTFHRFFNRQLGIPVPSRLVLSARQSIWLSGLLLVFIKTSPFGARSAEWVLTLLTGAEQQIIVDPTDLLGLLGLAAAAAIIGSPRPICSRGPAARVVFGSALVACAATSSPQEPAWNRVDVVDDTLVANDQWGGSAWVSRDQGRTWKGEFVDAPATERTPVTEVCLERPEAVCIRLAGPRVLESPNGGADWTTVWFLDDSEAWVSRQLSHDSSSARVEPQDLLVTSDGGVVIAMGSIAPIRRNADGAFTPTEVDLRSFPTGWVLLAIGLLIFGFGMIAARRLRARFVGSGLAVVGICLSLAGLPAMVGRDGFAAVFLFFAAVVVAVGFLIVMSIIKTFRVATAKSGSGAGNAAHPPIRRASVGIETAALAAVVTATALPHAAWNLGVFDWRMANTLLALIIVFGGLGFLGLTLRPIPSAQSAPGSGPMPEAPAPPFHSPAPAWSVALPSPPIKPPERPAAATPSPVHSSQGYPAPPPPPPVPAFASSPVGKTAGSARAGGTRPLPLPFFLATVSLLAILAFGTLRFLLGTVFLLVIAILVRNQGWETTWWRARVTVVMIVGLLGFVVPLFLNNSRWTIAGLVAASLFILFTPPQAGDG